MSINVSTSMGFENREFLKDNAKKILQKQGASSEQIDEITNNVRLTDYKPIDLNILSMSSQITLSNSIKETLKYLRSHSRDKRKKYILGELWEQFDNTKDNVLQSELINFEVDDTLENIFAA